MRCLRIMFIKFITTNLRKKSTLREAVARKCSFCLLSCWRVPLHISINTSWVTQQKPSIELSGKELDKIFLLAVLSTSLLALSRRIYSFSELIRFLANCIFLLCTENYCSWIWKEVDLESKLYLYSVLLTMLLPIKLSHTMGSKYFSVSYEPETSWCWA